MELSKQMGLSKQMELYNFPNHLVEQLQAGHVERFHTVQRLGVRTVAHHSFNIMLILNWMYDNEPPGRLMRAAMQHDLHEVYMGDIPYPIKQNLEIKDALKEIETGINNRMGIKNDLTESEQKTLDAVDLIEFMYYLLEERQLGNTNNQEIFTRAANIHTKNNYSFPKSEKLFEFKKWIIREWRKFK